MNLSVIKELGFVLILLLVGATATAQTAEKEKRTAVSMRKIGHQFLLKSGDNTSRVLPVEKQDDSYRISFDTIFEFWPDDLVGIVDRVLSESNLTKNYIIEIENCITKEIVYAYQVLESDDLDLIPCRTRKQAEGCYSVLFTDLSPDVVLTDEQGLSKETNFGLKITLSAFVLFLGFLFIRKTFKADNVEEGIDSKNIFIGSHRFDTVNLELELGETKEQLTSKESDLLLLLHRHVNEIVKREEILKSVWGDEGDYVGRTLDVFISKLRKRFQEDQNIKIVNVRGVGYKLIINTP